MLKPKLAEAQEQPEAPLGTLRAVV